MAEKLHALAGGTDSDLESLIAQQAVRRRVFGRGDPVLIGRFELRERIGAGGMGLVYAAHDPMLDRLVALKLMRFDRSEEAAVGRKRARAEAQVLAILNHPNVVTVYDVGRVHDILYFAMELVPGRDLRAWLEQPRTLEEIAIVFRGIADGIAAAHAAGIVHRDIKPENILVGTDGRARVADFGLARLLGRAPISDREGIFASASGTQPAGTPGYAAPEIVAGGPADERGDVFAYCTMLFEALFGRLPDPSERRPPSRRPGGEHVPRKILDAIAGGLAPHDRRIASMVVLRQALGAWTVRARRLIAIGVAGGIAVAAAAWAIDRAREVGAIAACEREGDAITTVWNDASREQLRAHVSRAGTSVARDAADRAVLRMDDYIAQWSEVRVAVCERAEVERTMNAAMHVRAQACLDERRARVLALLELAVDAEPEYAASFAPQIAGLPRPSACADEELLATELWPEDAEQRARMDDLVHDLARAQMLDRAWRYAEGLELARDVAARAHEHDLRALAADAESWVGWFLARLGRLPEAEETLERAFHLATHEQADVVAVHAASSLAYLVGVQASRPDEGLAWARHARSAAARAGTAEPLRVASIDQHVAHILVAKGDHAEALAHHERAHEAYAEAFGDDHPSAVKALNDMSAAARLLGDLVSAEAYATHAIAVYEAAFGPEHPDLGTFHTNLGLIAMARNDPRRARVHMQEKLDLVIAALGPDHPSTARAMANLAGVDIALKDHAAARQLLEDALAILERSVGVEHPDTIALMSKLATAQLRAGDTQDAEQLLRRARVACDATFGAEHRECVRILSELGWAAYQSGRYAEALAVHEVVLALKEHANDPVEFAIGSTLSAIASAHLALGQPREAVPVLERLLVARVAESARSEIMAETRYNLAVALWDSTIDRDRALVLARQARDDYRSAAVPPAKELQAVEAWLAAHDPAAP